MPREMTQDEKYEYFERVAIMYFDGKVPLSKAEFAALQQGLKFPNLPAIICLTSDN
jgi:hypothetical protein